jgi:hypothetical protein
MTLLVLLVVAVIAVLACCLLFVLHPEYHAGVVGNLGLCLIALASFSRLAVLLERGQVAYVSPQGVVLWIGLALFLGRHALKFALRAARRDSTWYRRTC